MAYITDNTGQYIVDYRLTNTVVKREFGGWKTICVANMVFPTKSRCYILVLLGISIFSVASGKIGVFKIFCSIIWQVLCKLIISLFFTSLFEL